MIVVPIPESFRHRPFAGRAFGRIAGWALANHPFYRSLGLQPGDPLPVLTRERVQAGNVQLLNGHAITACTSGSTSRPVDVSWSAARNVLELEDTARFLQWWGGPLPNMRIVSLASHEPDPKTIDVESPIPAQVEFMLRRHAIDGACSLVTYPTNLELLCRYIIEHGVDMSFLRRCTCFAEVYEPYHDALVARAFPNAQANCTYSSVEVGLIAARCPHRPDNYHVMAHKLGVEFLAEDGRPCRDGELGQVVVTDFYNRRSTLIRYALGDLAAPTSCDCGLISLPAMTRLVGKVRGVLKGRDGKPVMFASLAAMFRDSPEIRQFQVVQDTLAHFLIRYVPRDGADTAAFQLRAEAAFRSRYGEGSLVDFEPLPDIPKGPGGKFHAAICLA